MYIIYMHISKTPTAMDHRPLPLRFRPLWHHFGILGVFAACGRICASFVSSIWGSFWGLWGGRVLAPSCPQDGPKNQKYLPKYVRGPPYWGPSWCPKSFKVGPKRDPKCFSIDLKIDFCSHLEPSWPHPRPPNPPKMRPSFVKNRSNLEQNMQDNRRSLP